MFNKIPLGDIRALIFYDHLTGGMIWRERFGKFSSPGWNSKYAGGKALNIKDDKGYLHGRVLGVNVKAHRAAWAIHFGEWPEEFIDHVNGDRSDNRICNLRCASHSQNARNRRPSKNSTSSYLGVHWNSRDSIWEAQINDGERIIRLGKFSSEWDAAKAYNLAARDIHGEFANINYGPVAKW